MRKHENCIFCHREKIATGILYEDDLVMAFPDIDPVNAGHILLVPKEHFLDVDDMPDALLAHLMRVSKRLVHAMKEACRPDGYTIMQNGGAFNEIGHYHLHIFPRYDGDGFGYVGGKGTEGVSEEQLGEIWSGIAALLQKEDDCEEMIEHEG